MTATNALGERIADVLEGTASPDDIAAVIMDAEDEIAQLTKEAYEHHKVSLDPLARPDVSAKAREDTGAHRFAIERLKVALNQLHAKHKAAAAQVKRAKRAAHHAKVTAERDAVADEFGRRYPELAGALTDLLGRVEASNARVEAINRSGGPWIDPVETVARGVAPNGIHFLVTAVRLPPFKVQDQAMGDMLWPVPINHTVPVPPHVAEAAAREGDKARRIGEQVEARKRSEAKSSIRRVG